MRDSFIFYRSFHDATKELAPELYEEAVSTITEEDK